MRTGFLVLGHVRGAPVRLHWSAGLIAVLIGVTSGAGASVFTIVASLCVLGLIVGHEFGHAFQVWRAGHRVHSIDAYGFHGECVWSGNATRYEDAVIAWGGVLFQAALLFITLIITQLSGPPTTVAGATLAQVFIRTNLFMICLNLIPIAPLDGARAWPIVGLLQARWRQRKSGQGREGSKQSAPPSKSRSRARLRLVTPPPDDMPVSEESKRVADEAIREALARSRQKSDTPVKDDPDAPKL